MFFRCFLYAVWAPVGQGQAVPTAASRARLLALPPTGDMTVMLCVFDEGMDFAAAEAIKIARKHDPERLRTVGVATKIDLVDTSIDILAKLAGSSSNLALSLGIFPVSWSPCGSALRLLHCAVCIGCRQSDSAAVGTAGPRA